MNEENLNKIGNEMEIQYYQDESDDQISIRCSKLLRKCEQIKMENFRLISYIDHINKLVRKVRKQNVFITNKLEQNNDDYLYKVKPAILNEIEFVINYGKSKLKKENHLNKVKFNSNKKDNNEQFSFVDRNYDLEINQKSKKIKIENKMTDENLLVNNSTNNTDLTYPITIELNSFNSN